MKNLTFEELLDKLEKALTRIEALEKENATLRARLNMNSSNSSLPPSTDRFTKKKDRSLRKKSNKSSGGQIGHKGYTLNKVQKPDSIVDLELNICPHCKEKASAEFPSNVTNPTQYGANIRALITNLNIYHALPYNKIQELLKDIFNLNLSQGTIANTLKKAYVSLEKVENFFKEELKKVEFLHADETGTKVNGKNHWIHSCSNERYTVLTSHPNRGKKAIEEAGILPNFKGVLSHDCWYAYDCYPQILHSLCWAHFLRELQSIEENTDLEFPAKIREFILDLKEKIENKEEISNEKEMNIWLKYVALIEKGKKEERDTYQTDVLETKKRKSKAFNLLQRLSRYEDVLRFFIERKISIFTNNAAEREIRNIKVKSKIQGAFRSELGSQIYCRIRGYISTMKKMGKINILR